MGALRDILGYFTRGKFLKEADPEDVLIIGVHTEPDMTGVPGPVPVKDAKLIKIKDLNIESTPCENINVGTGAGVFAKQSTDPCVNEFRSLKSINLNLSIEQQGNEIEFDTTAEENQADNVGLGSRVFKDKTGEVLNFRSLTSTDGSIFINESKDGNEINFSCTTVPGISCTDLLSVLNASTDFTKFKENLAAFCAAVPEDPAPEVPPVKPDPGEPADPVEPAEPVVPVDPVKEVSASAAGEEMPEG